MSQIYRTGVAISERRSGPRSRARRARLESCASRLGVPAPAKVTHRTCIILCSMWLRSASAVPLGPGGPPAGNSADSDAQRNALSTADRKRRLRLDLRFAIAVVLLALVAAKLGGVAGEHYVFAVVPSAASTDGRNAPLSSAAGARALQISADLPYNASCPARGTPLSPYSTWSCPCTVMHKFDCEEVGCEEKQAGA